MVKIIIDNVYTKLIDIPQDVELIIWETLSFEVKEFQCEYVQIRHLYNRKTKKTYTGLLKYVFDILNNNDIKYEINDLRIKPEQNANFSLQDYITLPNGDKVQLKARDYQQKIIDNCNNREIIRAATGAGKSVPLDTPILTPDGFVLMKDIHIGDIVYDEDGNKTTVIGEYPQGKLQEYEILFNDGTTIKCCKDHLWKFATRDNLTNNKWQVKTLENILKDHKMKIGKNYNLSIPVCKPIQFDKKDLFLPPYLLGALLGDGGFSQSQITFTNTEEDIIDKVKNLSKQFGKIKSKDKFIPQEYKMSSIEDRIALLQGLFDTDGNIDEKGHIRFSSVSEQLIKDVQFILYSLGYRAKIIKIDRKEKGINYVLNVRGCDNNLFTSIKHTQKFNNRKRSKNHHYEVLKIVSITPLPTKSEMKCIEVDSPLHTYICKDFIVTHNTFIMAGIIGKFKIKPVSIFADKLSLCTQLQQEISKFLGEPIGLVGGGINDKKDITIFSAQSATEDDIKDSNMVMFDECFPANTLITLNNNTKKTIKEIVDNKLTPYIPTYNIKTNKIEYNKIYNHGKKINNKKLYKIKILDDDNNIHEIICTEDHKIYADNKYIQAKDLQLSQNVIIYPQNHLK